MNLEKLDRKIFSREDAEKEFGGITYRVCGELITDPNDYDYLAVLWIEELPGKVNVEARRFASPQDALDHAQTIKVFQRHSVDRIIPCERTADEFAIYGRVLPNGQELFGVKFHSNGTLERFDTKVKGSLVQPQYYDGKTIYMFRNITKNDLVIDPEGLKQGSDGVLLKFEDESAVYFSTEASQARQIVEERLDEVRKQFEILGAELSSAEVVFNSFPAPDA